MTQEERQLLLVDLCARLPYGVKVVDLDGWEFTVKGIDGNSPLVDKYSRFGNTYHTVGYGWKPYLRPMSNMTEEEIETYRAIIGSLLKNSVTDNVATLYNFLNSKHIDYRGLIPMGLALEAPEDMYKFL